MRLAMDPFRLLLIALAGWLNQQQHVIDYLQEENRVLREQLGAKRLRFNDDQRRRLAVRNQENAAAVWAKPPSGSARVKGRTSMNLFLGRRAPYT